MKVFVKRASPVDHSNMHRCTKMLYYDAKLMNDERVNFSIVFPLRWIKETVSFKMITEDILVAAKGEPRGSAAKEHSAIPNEGTAPDAPTKYL